MVLNINTTQQIYIKINKKRIFEGKSDKYLQLKKKMFRTFFRLQTGKVKNIRRFFDSILILLYE